MRELPQDFKARLDSQLNFLCRAWIITPKIGAIIRVCEHDKDIEIDGEIYKSIDSFDGGAIEIQNSLAADRMSISAALNAQGVTREAILLGHFDKAKVEALIVDWQAPQFFAKIWEGLISRAIIHDFGFEFELAGYETELNRPIGRQFTRHCAAILGDSNCKIDLNSPDRSFMATISQIQSLSSLKITTSANIETSEYANGEIKFQNGICTGFKARISNFENSGGLILQLENPLPIAPNINDEIRVFSGCDKSFDCCKARFQNGENFFGFPNMPGEGMIYAAP